MSKTSNHPFLIFLLLISFASVNAVMITPALPAVTAYFHLTHHQAQHVLLYYLVGYAIAQLIYSPLATKYGYKQALYIGLSIQIAANFICILAGILKLFWLLIFGRIILALGAGACLSMTFTAVNEFYSPREATKKTAHLLMSFAFLPELSMVLGGILNHKFGWISCCIAGAIYGAIVFMLITKLPELTLKSEESELELHNIIESHLRELKNTKLLTGACLLGLSNSTSYIFAAIAPFVAINLLGFNSSEYGIALLLPSYGIKMGSLATAKLTDMLGATKTIKLALITAIIASIGMLINTWYHLPAIESIFLPMMLYYFGMTAIFSNGAVKAMNASNSKIYGSGMMNFINLSIATIAVMILSWVKITIYLLPITLLIVCGLILTFVYNSHESINQ